MQRLYGDFDLNEQDFLSATQKYPCGTVLRNHTGHITGVAPDLANFRERILIRWAGPVAHLQTKNLAIRLYMKNNPETITFW